MAKYTVTGTTPLRGKVELHGAKNAGFKAMIAALLADSPSTITNLGLISEIGFAKNVISSIGGKVEETDDPHNLVVNPSGLADFAIPHEIGEKSRSSMMYVGPLLARFGKAVIPTPGGDVVIGKRPIDRHLDGLRAMGAKVDFDEKSATYEITAANGLSGCTYTFSKITHTGTETLLMAAVKANGKTVLENCALDPEIDNLIDFLNKMGAKVARTRPGVIEIEGVKNLHGATHRIIPDRIEVGTYACMALGTKGEIEIIGADAAILTSLLGKVSEVGGIWQSSERGIVFRYENPLRATAIETTPYPGFLTDWQPLWTTLMTQAEGTSVVHETIHDNRFGFVANLLNMGANIELFNPPVNNPEQIYSFNLDDAPSESRHAARVIGPTALQGLTVEINEIRGGATALLAGLIAKGTTVILDPKDQVNRGYESLPERLVSLGANISVN